jgi:hypothetical protein
MPVRHSLRRLLFAVGWRLSGRTLQRIDNSLNYMACAHWAKSRNLDRVPSFPDRRRLFERIAADVAAQRTLYLEFGVYQGESIRLWSRLLRHPQARLHGFDSFEGLPEDWTSQMPRGHFSTGGAVPSLDDPRVQFFKGWFDQILPTYRPPEHDRLVVSLDADLYSSTKYVLDWLRPYLVPGTYLYFDEFCHRHHEMKAFGEFLQAAGMEFEIIGQSRCWEHAAFRRVGSRSAAQTAENLWHALSPTVGDEALHQSVENEGEPQSPVAAGILSTPKP